MMKIKSLNVGLPREATWNHQTVLTGIFKEPVTGPVMLRRLNFDGDRQADLSVHGGPTKAAYAYPHEHYAYWRNELPDHDLPVGMFGENLTTEGFDEESVCIGDRFRIGQAVVVVTEPRMPCQKLAIKFGRADILKRFLKSQRTGFYFGVVEEGIVQAGDEITRISQDAAKLKVIEVTQLYSTERDNASLLAKAISVETLPESWRQHFTARLARLNK